MYQISSGDSINSKRLFKDKYENIVYKSYNNSQINTDVNTIGSKIWDIVQVVKVFLKLGFTPCKAEHPLQCMELQEKEAQKD